MQADRYNQVIEPLVADRYYFLEENETFWATPSRAQDAGEKATMSGIIAAVNGRKVFQVEDEGFKSPSGLCKACFTRGPDMTNEWDGRNHLYVERNGRRVTIREAGNLADSSSEGSLADVSLTDSASTDSASTDSASTDSDSVSVTRRRRLVPPPMAEPEPEAQRPIVVPAPQVTVINKTEVKWAYAAPLWIIAACALVHTVSISAICAFFEI